MKNLILRLFFGLAMVGLVFPISVSAQSTSEPLNITSPLVLPSGLTGKHYTYQFKARGGKAPYKWEVTTEQLNVYHCCLIGLYKNGKFTSKGLGDNPMPYSGTFQIGVKVTDRNGQTDTQVSQYTISTTSTATKKYKAGAIETISATNISGWAYDNDRSVEVKAVIENVNKRIKKKYKFEVEPTIMRPDIGSYLSNKFAIGGILVPLGFSFNPSEQITAPGTYRIKSIKYNGKKFNFNVDPKTTFTIP